MEITGLSLSEVDKLAQRFKSKVTLNIRRVGTRFNRASRSSTTILQDTGRIKREWSTVVDNVLIPHLHIAWLTGATTIQHQLDSVEDAIVSSAEIPIRTQNGDSFLAKARERLLSIGDELWDRINKAIAESLSLKETDLTTYQLVADIIEVTIENVAELIAVSEFHNMIIRSQYAQMLTSKRSPTKTWRTHSDFLVRASHSSVADKTIPLREMFDVHGQWMDGPYDPTAPAGEVYNCRCWLTYGIDVVEEKRKALIASADNHSQAMIALVPTQEDAERLAIEGYEPVEELHLTLAFLGEAKDIPDDMMESLASSMSQKLKDFAITEEITSKAFGVAHWNPGGDSPSWVLNIGDASEIENVLVMMSYVALEVVHDCDLEIPEQHSPFVAHVCLAYADASFASQLSECIARLGPITFDRIRIAIGEESKDIPLSS